MSIQQVNRKLSAKEKLSFIEVIKGGTYIRIGLGFSLCSLTKTNSAEGKGNIKTY